VLAVKVRGLSIFSGIALRLPMNWRLAATTSLAGLLATSPIIISHCERVQHLF
jgi:hypothetical protein